MFSIQSNSCVMALLLVLMGSICWAAATPAPVEVVGLSISSAQNSKAAVTPAEASAMIVSTLEVGTTPPSVQAAGGRSGTSSRSVMSDNSRNSSTSSSCFRLWLSEVGREDGVEGGEMAAQGREGVEGGEKGRENVAAVEVRAAVGLQHGLAEDLLVSW